jgi:hypothetical protein
MFLVKLCEVLETDINGLHDSLCAIPEITVLEFPVYAESKNTICKCFNRYGLKKDDISFSLILWQDGNDDGASLLAFIEEGKSFRAYTPIEEAETLFLELIAKRIVRVKSARN